MMAKYARCGHNMQDNIICLDSYDGAIHSKSNKGRKNIVSYNSQLFSKNSIEAGRSPAGSFDILT